MENIDSKNISSNIDKFNSQGSENLKIESEGNIIAINRQAAQGLGEYNPQPIKSDIVTDQAISNGLPEELPAAKLNSATSLPLSIATPSKTNTDDEHLPEEWIKAAKSIIESTRDEPHKRDEEVAKLRKDYQHKRYGDN